jgi:hypothetical protein
MGNGTNNALAVECAKKLDAKLKWGEAGVRTQSGESFGRFKKCKMLCVGSQVEARGQFLGGPPPASMIFPRNSRHSRCAYSDLCHVDGRGNWIVLGTSTTIVN